MSALPVRWRIRASIACAVLPPLLNVVSLPALTRWLTRSAGPRSPVPGVDEHRLGDWVDRVLTRMPKPWNRTCLKRALVLYYLLHRAGRAAELRIGVRRSQEHALEAHAWLERNGIPILEGGGDHVGTYQVLSRFS